MKRLWYCRVLKQRSFARTSTLFLGHSYYYLAAVRAAVARGVAARASVARGVAARAATDCCLHALARGKQQPPAKGANLASPRPTLYDNFTWEEIPGKKDTATQRQPNWQRRVERESPPCILQPLRRMNCGSAGPTMNCLSRVMTADCGCDPGCGFG